MNNVINIDWLQFCGKTTFTQDIEKVLSIVWNVELAQYGNRYYKKVWHLSKDKEPLFCLMTEPHSTIIDNLEINVRVDNRLLYNNDLWACIDKLINMLQITNINVTRCDICNDFNLFANGMHAKDVIFELANHKYRKVGKSKFAIYGIQTKSGLIYNGIRYGVHGSELSVYLYNKTLELKEKVYKPYIVERWLDFGLNPADVWRLELSLMPKSRLFVDKKTGESYTIDLETLRTAFVKLYYLLVAKHFKVIDITSLTDSNISRAVALPLLEFSDNKSSAALTRVSCLSNSTNYDKGIINYLDKFEDTKLFEQLDVELSNEDISILRRSSILLRRLLHL